VIRDADQAGFVQVVQGRGSDPERAKQLMAQDADKWAELRAQMGEMNQLSIGGPEFFDLKQPIRSSPD
jgi:hypothetical protein